MSFVLWEIMLKSTILIVSDLNQIINMNPNNRDFPVVPRSINKSRLISNLVLQKDKNRVNYHTIRSKSQTVNLS